MRSNQFGICHDWLPEEVEALKQTWPKNSKTQILDLFPGISWSSLCNKAFKLNLRRSKKYNVNQEFFCNWSDNMAYVLGMFYSDGCMSQPVRSNRSVSFYSVDLNHLEQIREVMSSTHLIYSHKTKNLYSLQIHDLKLWNSLIELGCTPAKTLTLKYPETLPLEYFKHFVRGLIDGDGCLHWQVYKTGGRIPKLNMLGTENLLQGINENIAKLIGLGLKKIQKQSAANIYVLTYCGIEATKLAMWLYQDALLCLERKREISQDFIDFWNDRYKNGKQIYDAYDQGLCCTYCKSCSYIKNGTKYKKQRYLCKSCNKHFTKIEIEDFFNPKDWEQCTINLPRCESVSKS